MLASSARMDAATSARGGAMCQGRVCAAARAPVNNCRDQSQFVRIADVTEADTRERKT